MTNIIFKRNFDLLTEIGIKAKSEKYGDDVFDIVQG